MIGMKVYGYAYVLLMNSQKWQMTIIIFTALRPATAHLVLFITLSLYFPSEWLNITWWPMEY